MRSDLRAQLVLHEGLRLRPYLDGEGNWTVLVGYNLTARGWGFIERVLGRTVVPTNVSATKPFGDTLFCLYEALLVLDADLDRVERGADKFLPEYSRLSQVRQRVVIDMAFNMGFKALGFKNAIAAVKRQDWSRASRELYLSRWSRQVGDGPGGKFDRCDRLARMLLTNKPPTDVPAV